MINVSTDHALTLQLVLDVGQVPLEAGVQRLLLDVLLLLRVEVGHGHHHPAPEAHIQSELETCICHIKQWLLKECQKSRRIGCVITYNAGSHNLSFDVFDISEHAPSALTELNY